MKNNPLAKLRREKIIEYLYQCSLEKTPPSIREIGEYTEIPSTSVVNWYIDHLEKEGCIRKTKRISRGISLTREGERWALSLLKIRPTACPHCGAPVNPDGKFEEKKKTEKPVVKYKAQRMSVPA